MNFEISDDQQQLRDSLQRLLAKTYAFPDRQQALAASPGWRPDVWRQLGELGVTGLGVPEAWGGLGGDARDRLAVHIELGRVLSLEPYLGSVVLGGALVQAIGGDCAETLLPEACTGERLLAVAHAEPDARHDPWWVQTRAVAGASGWQLTGEKTLVLHGADAHDIFVSARLQGQPGDALGLGIFRVKPDAPGAHVQAHALADRTRAARLSLRDARAELLVQGQAASAALWAMRRAGIAAACAEGLGVMQGALALTVSYLRERRQFGQPIGTYQALRHRVAEMKVAIETVTSAAYAAACAGDAGDDEAIDTELARAKLLLGRHGIFVTQQAIQLHGGIGMTQEYAVGHYLRRMTVLDQLCGDAAHHGADLERRLRARAAA